jgi:hypothetical protein
LRTAWSKASARPSAAVNKIQAGGDLKEFCYNMGMEFGQIMPVFFVPRLGLLPVPHSGGLGWDDR